MAVNSRKPHSWFAIEKVKHGMMGFGWGSKGFYWGSMGFEGVRWGGEKFERFERLEGFEMV